MYFDFFSFFSRIDLFSSFTTKYDLYVMVFGQRESAREGVREGEARSKTYVYFEHGSEDAF